MKLLLVANVNATLGEKLMFVVVAPNAPFTGVWLVTAEESCTIEEKPNGTSRRSSASWYIRVICKMIIM